MQYSGASLPVCENRTKCHDSEWGGFVSSVPGEKMVMRERNCGLQLTPFPAKSSTKTREDRTEKCSVGYKERNPWPRGKNWRGHNDREDVSGKD